MIKNESNYIECVLQEGTHKKAVTLQISQSYLAIDNASWSLAAVKLELGGNKNNILFIHLNDHQTVYFELTLQNKEILRRDNLSYDYFKPLVEKKSSAYKIELAIGLSFLLLISGIIYYRAIIFSQLSVLVPYSFEKKIGDKVFSQSSDSQLTQIRNVENQMRHLLKNLNSFDETKYTIHISSKSELNAYATIGGHIFINQGLIKKMEKPEQLIGVIAHEIVHVQNRHVVKSIFQSVGLFVIFQAFLGDISGLVAVVVDQGGPLLSLSYSRDLETEADLLAVQALIESQIDPKGLSDALNIIDRESQKIISESPGGKILSQLEKQNILRSHPQTLDRVESMQKMIESQNKKNKYKDMALEWKQIQKSVQSL